MTTTHPTITHSTPVSSLLPNSIAPCSPISEVGASVPVVHIGHSGQPRPEPVTRTIPPPTTIAMAATTDVVAAHRTLRGPSVNLPAAQERGVRTIGLP